MATNTGGDRMNRAEQFYKRLHQAIGLTVQDNDSLATMTEALIMHRAFTVCRSSSGLRLREKHN